jgi:hypothetical protein
MVLGWLRAAAAAPAATTRAPLDAKEMEFFNALYHALHRKILLFESKGRDAEPDPARRAACLERMLVSAHAASALADKDPVRAQDAFEVVRLLLGLERLEEAATALEKDAPLHSDVLAYELHRRRQKKAGAVGIEEMDHTMLDPADNFAAFYVTAMMYCDMKRWEAAERMLATHPLPPEKGEYTLIDVNPATVERRVRSRQ